MEALGVAHPRGDATPFVVPARGALAWLRKPVVTVSFLATMLVANLLVVAYVSREQTVYFWDYSGYWDRSRQLTDELVSRPGRAARHVLFSVAHGDYNLLPAVPVAFLMLLFGSSRLGYELAVLNSYLAGTLLTLLVLVRRFSDPGTGERRLVAVSLAMLLLWPVVWAPLLRGLPDLGGVVLINVILLVYFQRPATELRWRGLAAVGFLLAGLVLFRRWYAFWALHFLLLVLLEGGVWLIQARRFGLRDFQKAVRPALTAGLAALLVLGLLARPLLLRVASTDYADIYSSYHAVAGWAAPETTARSLGYLHVLPFLVGAAALAALARTRRLVVFLFLQACLVYLDFNRTQSFGPHHLYLFAPAVLLVLALSWVKVLGGPRLVWASLAFGAFTLLSLGTCVLALTTTARGPLKAIEPLASVCKVPPLVRGDLGELQRLAVVLDELTRKKNEPIYVLSSSYVLNADHLVMSSASLALPFDLRGRLIPVAHLDKRDGFPHHLLSAALVVVGDPVQLHLPDGQRVIACPTESFLLRKDLGQAFERLPLEFHLDQGVRAWIYRKTRAIEKTEVAAFCERLRACYPDRPFVWKPVLKDEY